MSGENDKFDGMDDMNRANNVSKCVSAWLNIRETEKKQEDLMKSEKDADFMKIVNDVRKKRKGKAVSVESKVSGANIKEWVKIN